MQKLLAKFKASRSLADARRLVTYNRKHPFTDVFLTAEEQALLIEANSMVRAEVSQ